eukprot:TRINITY_DN2444_c0_g2_i2.p1 TRINITY_DN2444_c0_g2~~TRINITY_DN2444_c0_g2_i2.p1  ORF type:complete len:120 (-),score=30.26 TRINITY_DN2444_c0_g2_i2:47-406(-)
MIPVEDFNISREMFAAHIETIFVVWEDIRVEIRDTLYCKNVGKTLKVAGISVVLSIFSQFISGAGLLWTGLVVLFVYPRLYHEKHVEIDAGVEKVQVLVGVQFDKLATAVPMLNKLKSE